MRLDLPQRSGGRQGGVTLVELMVAMVLGLVLIGGVIQVFLSSRETYRVNESVARLQENGRFAIDVIARDLRQAGLPACMVRDGIVFNRLQGVPQILELDAPLDGWEAATTGPGAQRSLDASAALVDVATGDWSSRPGTAVTALSALPGADVLRLRRMAEFPPEVTAVASNGAGAAEVTAARTSTLRTGDIFVLCNTGNGVAHVVQACAVEDVTVDGAARTRATLSDSCSPGNQLPLELGGGWAGAGVLAVPREIVYFIGKRGNAPDSVPGLFRRVDVPGAGTTGVAEELVEGVENLQVLFGVDLTGNLAVDEYRTADQVPAWDRVVAVRVGLLMVSLEDNIAAQEATPLNLLGTTLVPPAGDRRLRQTMSATVSLRNRTP